VTVGTLNITANVQGAPTGARSLNLVTPLNSAIDQTSMITLTTGANTITVPSNLLVSCAVILPPNSYNPTPNPASTAVLTLKGVSGDTGIVISSKYATVLEWDIGTAPATFVINASSGCTIEIWYA